MTFADRKEIIRRQILVAAQAYKGIAGKVFLYVYGDEFFEVVFYVNRFSHLTGVKTKVPAEKFYEYAENATLSDAQFWFDSEHPYRNAKKKLPSLIQLPTLTNNVVCVVKGMETISITYKIGLTNLDFTLGLVENTNSEGVKINNWLVPRTLRVRDRAIENSPYAEFIDFIFMKDASKQKYDVINYADAGKIPPDSIRELLTEDIVSKLYL